MSRVTVRIDAGTFDREFEALTRRMRAAPQVREAVHDLATHGVSMVEVVPTQPGGKAVRLRAQLSQPYWAILEREAA